MANQTMTRVPDAWRRHWYNQDSGYDWTEYSSENVSTTPILVRDYLTGWYGGDYTLSLPAKLSTVISVTLSVKATRGAGTQASGSVLWCNCDTGNLKVYSAKVSNPFVGSSTDEKTVKFEFKDLNATDVGSITFDLDPYDGLISAVLTDPVVTIVYSEPTLGLAITPSEVSAGSSVSLTFSNRLSRELSVKFAYNSTELTSLTVTSDSKSVTCPESWFSTAGVTGNSMRVTVTATDPLGRTATANLTVTRPALTVNASPTEVVTGNYVNVTVNKSSKIRFLYSSTVLRDYGSYSTSHSVNCPESWFDTAGVSGNSMRVTVEANDGTRTATTTITLQKPQALTPSTVAPKSVTREGSEEITFSWNVSGSWGSLSKSELQYSTDNANWNALGTVSGSGKTLTKSGVTFPPGTIYWRVRVYNTYGLWSDWTAAASFTVKYAATSYVVPLNSPTGGNVNAAEPLTFAGTLLSDGTPYQPFTMAAATFYWRSPASNPYTSVAMSVSGANASVTIPGGTFPAGTVSWYIEATDNTGASSQTEVYNISTLASEIDAQPVSPVGVIETKNTPTDFTWHYATVTGSEQMAAELEYSMDGSAWISLGSVTGEATTFTAAANALPSGTIYWRVRAENAAGVWGPWCSPATFINFGAPDVLSVVTDSKPYTTITWQVNTQESYKITVDGVVVAHEFGESVRSFTLTQPLKDGQHSVEVQVQNEYGQWSPANGTIFEVQNVPTAELTLRHRTDVDTDLTWFETDYIPWRDVDITGDFFIYRDGVPIAHTTGTSFSDRVVLGTHDYFVIEKLQTGYYNRSNTVTATMSVGRCPMIAPLAGGKWLRLALSTSADRVIQISEERRTAERFVLGADYPEVEIGRHRTKRASLDAAWLRGSLRHDTFKALLGSAVILKLPWGDVIIGVLTAFEQSNARFASGYSYSLSQMNWRDYLEDA